MSTTFSDAMWLDISVKPHTSANSTVVHGYHTDVVRWPCRIDSATARGNSLHSAEVARRSAQALHREGRLYGRRRLPGGSGTTRHVRQAPIRAPGRRAALNTAHLPPSLFCGWC